MLAILYLVLCMLAGFALVIVLVPRVMQRKILTTIGERARNPFFALFPACFLSGTALVTWLVYIVGCLMRNTEHPLRYANAVALPLTAVGSVIAILCVRKRVRFKEFARSLRPTTSEMVYFAVSLAMSVVLMIASFRVIHGEIIIASPVVEDFALHVNLIRSFSVWEKVPAQFPYFTGAGINYHFMMDFLAGNLELLGLRIDFAYNLPSILAMTAFFCGVYECFFRLCGKKNYCHFVWLLVMFRSSLGIFRFLKDNAGNLREAFKLNRTYMGATEYEWWGIYQSNSLLNQRHLIFGYAAAMFVVSLFLPYLIRGLQERAEIRKECAGTGLTSRIKAIFRKEAMPRKKSSVLTAVYAGLCLGMCGLFSAHSVIASLLLLFVIAWFSSDQVSFLITAVIAAGLSCLETSLCTESMGLFELRFVKAWVLENASFGAVLKHFWLLLGIMIPLLIIRFLCADAVNRVMIAASVILFAFGFHVLMSPEPLQNHKYMLLAIYWFGIQAGIALCNLLSAGRKRITRIGCMITTLMLLVPLTATGVYDLYLVLEKCKTEYGYKYECTPPFLEWAEDNGVDRDTLFLAPDNFIGMMTTCGFQNYNGYYGFVHDAGYDATTRQEITERIIHAENEADMRKAVEECGADFLVIQYRVRKNDTHLNEELIAAVYPKVFTRWSGVSEFAVYDLRKN
ncbi:MAG: hypothetical protein IKI15_06655 [Lachnospiraceae bacterium]|nr:hypothetical protein [Lachnospiraceae bacterium]